MPTYVPLPARTSGAVPVRNRSRATPLVYTGGVAGRAEIENVRDYYAKILPFYELESVARAHLNFWRAIVRQQQPARILEIGAGLGRITSALARLAPAVGIDLSMEMLSVAPYPRRRKAGRKRGAPAARIRDASFVAADMRRAHFGPVFDLIVGPGDPLSHLTTMKDRRGALRAVAAQLAPGGRFVLEGLYRRRLETAMPRRRVRHAAGVLEIEEAWFPVGVGNLWHARYRYRDRRPGEPDRTAQAFFVARSWDPVGVRRLFASCGLRVEHMWGDLDRRPFWRGAPRVVIVARRRTELPRR